MDGAGSDFTSDVKNAGTYCKWVPHPLRPTILLASRISACRKGWDMKARNHCFSCSSSSLSLPGCSLIHFAAATSARFLLSAGSDADSLSASVLLSCEPNFAPTSNHLSARSLFGPHLLK